ncbi:MAG: hypothetical protein V4628_12260 [Pseudomonadota bacterium]
MEIYLLMAVHDYDGANVVSAFASREQALMICQAANEHLKAEPEFSMEMTKEQEAEFQKKLDEWGATNPAGTHHYSGDRYAVRQIEVINNDN